MVERKCRFRTYYKEEQKRETTVGNVLKKMLRQELGKQKYQEYAACIKSNIKESKKDTSEIFNDIYAVLQEKEAEELQKVQEHLNTSLLTTFEIGRHYFGAVVVYLVAFALLGAYVIQMVAIPTMLFISALFLVKTYEFLVNKFCYIDARMVLIFRAALERVLIEQRRRGKLTE